jgi:tetratricopeptide (TPR) repeat protein
MRTARLPEILYLISIGGSLCLGAVGQRCTSRAEAVNGLASARNGDLRNAETQLRAAVAFCPDDPTLLGSLGAILGMQNKLDESSTFLERALASDPGDWATRRNLASNEFQLGKLDRARRDLQMVLKQRPADKASLLLLGMVSEEMGDYPATVRLLTSVQDLVSENSKSIAALARAYYQTGAEENARTTLDQLLSPKLSPSDVILGARIAGDMGDFPTAERMLGRCWSEHPGDTELGYELAVAQYRSAKVILAQATIRKLLSGGYQTADTFNLLGWCLHKQGQLKEAVAAFDLAIERAPAAETNYIDLGLVLLSHNRLPVAIEAANKAVEVAPESYAAHMLKGLVEARMHRFAGARASYTRAMQLKLNVPEPLIGLAVVLSADGRTEEAERVFKQGLENFPNDARLYQEYGKMLLDLGDKSNAEVRSRARSLFVRALRLNNSLWEAHLQLGNLALADGRTGEALQYLEAAAKLHPRSTKTHFALARVYRRLGRSADAAAEIARYEKARTEEENAPIDSASRGVTAGIPSIITPRESEDGSSK